MPHSDEIRQRKWDKHTWEHALIIFSFSYFQLSLLTPTHKSLLAKAESILSLSAFCSGSQTVCLTTFSWSVNPLIFAHTGHVQTRFCVHVGLCADNSAYASDLCAWKWFIRTRQRSWSNEYSLKDLLCAIRSRTWKTKYTWALKCHETLLFNLVVYTSALKKTEKEYIY